MLPVPVRTRKLEGTLPPAVSGAVKLTGVGPEATSRKPAPVPEVMALEEIFGSCVSTEAGTVKPPVPAVVVQINCVAEVTALAPEPVVVPEYPTISTRSEEFPPVQASGKPALSLTEAGNPPVMDSGAPTLMEVWKLPTSCPPAPFKL